MTLLVSTSCVPTANRVGSNHGSVAVSWYACRDDTNNVRTKFYAAVSRDGGLSFSRNVRLDPGQSDATLVTQNPLPLVPDYWDYTGLAYHGGFFYSAWADNSISTGGNPDGDAQMDIYVVKVSDR